MENVWLITALWVGLALAAAVLSVRLAVPVALTEIVVGAVRHVLRCCSDVIAERDRRRDPGPVHPCTAAPLRARDYNAD